MAWVYIFAGFFGGLFCAGLFIGVFIQTKPGQKFALKALNVLDPPKFIPFEKSIDPPDEGIEQRIYKPHGTPAHISRHAIGRRHRRD